MKPKKVFSQKLCKSYWLAPASGPPQAGLPVFSYAEAGWIKDQALSAAELEWLYAARLEDWRTPIMPAEKVEIKPILSALEASEEVVKAREACLAFVKATLRPIPKETDAKDAPGYPEGDAEVSNP